MASSNHTWFTLLFLKGSVLSQFGVNWGLLQRINDSFLGAGAYFALVCGIFLDFSRMVGSWHNLISKVGCMILPMCLHLLFQHDY